MKTNTVFKKMHDPVFIAALSTTAEIQKRAKRSSTEQCVRGGTYIQQNGTQPKREWRFAIFSNMDYLGRYPMKNKSEQDRYYMISLIHEI